MKKFILIAIIMACVTLSSHSADHKMWIGGGIGFDYGWSSDGVEFMLRPGMQFKLNERWSLTGKINLLEFANLDESSAFGLHVTTGLSVGFLYNF